jgi:segregation and condensation protein A
MLGELRLQLAEFEGPLPLLLHLIERHELEVTRVSVAAVADQFMALVAEGGRSDLAITGEFVAMAARLLLIKSRALLRAPLNAPDSLGEADDAETLARQIAEYRRYQAAARGLGHLLEGQGQTAPRPTVQASSAGRSRPPAIATSALRRAAVRLLCAAPVVALPAAGWPEVEYAALHADLLVQLRQLRRTTFSPLCKGAFHPLVAITLFLAVLEMMRSGVLWLSQEQPYGPIDVELRELVGTDA